MTIQFQPLSSDFYQIPKAQILFKPNGSDAMELLGDADDVTVEVTTEVTERYSNEYGKRTLVKSIVNQVGATLAMTLVQISDRNRALSLLGEVAYDTQAAAAGQTFSLAAPEHGGKMYKLPDFDISNVTVLDGGVIPYVEGVNYKIDLAAGIIQLIVAPGGSDGDVEIEYDRDAIVAGDLRARIGVAGVSENRGTIIIRGTNDVGPRQFLQLHDVSITPAAARAYISDTDLATLELEGQAYADGTQAAGYEIGFERSLA